MIVVGLDLSLTSTGIAWLDLDDRNHGCATIHTEPDHADPMHGARLEIIKNSVWYAIRDADHVVVEDLPNGAKGVAYTARVHAIVGWMLARDRIPYTLVPPATLKMFALGKGVGTKTEMTLAASRRLGYEGHSDDESDALWLAHLGAHLLGHPAVDLPRSEERRVGKECRL